MADFKASKGQRQGAPASLRETYTGGDGVKTYLVDRTGNRNGAVSLSPGAALTAGTWKVEEMAFDDSPADLRTELDSGTFAASTPVNVPLLSATKRFVLLTINNADDDVAVEMSTD